MKSLPRFLYQYRRVEADQKTGIIYSIENLKACSIWYSKPGDFDDPFDCVLPFQRKDLSSDELKALFVNVYERMEEKSKPTFIVNYREGEDIDIEKFRFDVPKLTMMYHDEWRSKVSNWGIACFSETYDNVLMWAHYSSGHRGFCLEFDTSFLPFKKAEEVTYQTAIPSYTLLDLYKDPADILSPMVKTKADFWHYQAEWRIYYDEGQKLHPYDPEALTGIYFGCNMSPENKENIMRIPGNNSIQYYDMKKSDNQFRLVRNLIPHS